MDGPYMAALYERLSREDGDRPESDSIINQRKLLEDFCARRPELHIVRHYSDDGYSGTNFERPAFRRMLADIEAGEINCVIVKDLSRFGRDYIEMGRYLERVFPQLGLRFIAVGDDVDSARGPYDLMLPLKNVFNAQYARDISGKVRSSFRAKRERGEFIGAFACFGYQKDPQDSDRLLIDPPAAEIVRRIYNMYEGGDGKLRIARVLNDAGVPCPSVYKRQMGLKYDNGRRLDSTAYWTYASLDRILKNPMYAGDMAQAKTLRPAIHARAKTQRAEDWVLVPDTHPAIIERGQWERVQTLLRLRSRETDFDGERSLFAGFLKCGDCGRAMAKSVRTYRGERRVSYVCGSYKRYGAGVCSAHRVEEEALQALLLSELNALLSSVPDWREIALAALRDADEPQGDGGRQLLRRALSRTQRLLRGCYEDYKDGLISREEYESFRADYRAQEASLRHQLEREEQPAEPSAQPWIEALLADGRLSALDRLTLCEAVEEIRVFEGHSLDILYRFAPPQGDL